MIHHWNKMDPYFWYWFGFAVLPHLLMTWVQLLLPFQVKENPASHLYKNLRQRHLFTISDYSIHLCDCTPVEPFLWKDFLKLYFYFMLIVIMTKLCQFLMRFTPVYCCFYCSFVRMLFLSLLLVLIFINILYRVFSCIIFSLYCV